MPKPVIAERGTVTLWVLGLCVCVLFLGGLSLDLWRAVGERRALSAMADAAAAAGANGIDEAALRAGRVELDPVRGGALAQSQLDPTQYDAADIAVARDRVRVTLRGHVDFSLLGIFLGGEQFDIEAHAIASPDERP
jgi:hypothetical protein